MTMNKSIYCLVENDVIKYVGQSTDPERRYKEHLRLSNNKNNTPRSNWLRQCIKSGNKPELVILSKDTEDYDEAEKYWINHFRLLGQAKYNTSDGGQDTNYLRRAKANKPWGSSWSPLQKRYISIKSTVREFRKRGWDTGRLEAALVVMDTIVERLGADEVNERLWAKHHG